MDRKQERDSAVAGLAARVEDALRGGVTESGLETAKQAMLDLAARRDLFVCDEFAPPDDGRMDRTILIYEQEPGGMALYVNSSWPGQTASPHDHGGAWAIVAGVDGEETHRTYEADGDTARQTGEVVVRPGTAIVLGPDGIHSIHATSDKPLLHLHLYGAGFEHQQERRAFDMENGTVRRFSLDDVGFIEDGR